jgi:hypothetical protein
LLCLGAGLGVVVAHLREPRVAVDEEDGLGGVVEADDVEFLLE